MILDDPRVNQIISKTIRRFSDDIDAGTQAAFDAIKKLPNYLQLVDPLVFSAVRGKIWNARHNATWNAKAAAERQGFSAKPSKIIIGLSRDVQAAARSFYDSWYIGGMTLGRLTGEELIPLADAERARSSGCLLNAMMLEKLRPMVADHKTVRECVPERRARAIFRKLKETAAAA